jgi:hypothetical protein
MKFTSITRRSSSAVSFSISPKTATMWQRTKESMRPKRSTARSTTTLQSSWLAASNGTASASAP